MDNQSNQTSTMSTPANDALLSDHVRIFLSVFIILCSAIANLLVIAIVCCNANMRTSFNYLIVNMSVSDLIVPFVAIPTTLARDLHNDRWFVDGYLGEGLCKFCYFLTDMAPAVSVFSLVIIAVNRFVAIVFPMDVNAFNKKRTARLLIIVPWVVSTAFCSHMFYTMRLVRDRNYLYCRFSTEPGMDIMAAARIYIILILVLFFIIPFIVIAVMYTIIILKIIQSSENVSSMIQDNRSRKYRDRQIFYLSIVIIVAFGVLWGPLYVYHASRLFGGYADPTVDFVCYVLSWSNSIINPLICILFNGKFRQGFKRLFCRFYWKSQRVTIQSRPTRTTKQSKDSNSSSSVDRFQVITAV